MLHTILKKLQGKKTTIASIIGLVVVFSANRGYIPQDTSELIMSILTVLGLSANVATSRMAK